MNDFKTNKTFKNKYQSMDLYGLDDQELCIDVDGEIYSNQFDINKKSVAIAVIETIANHFDVNLKILEK